MLQLSCDFLVLQVRGTLLERGGEGGGGGGGGERGGGGRRGKEGGGRGGGEGEPMVTICTQSNRADAVVCFTSLPPSVS